FLFVWLPHNTFYRLFYLPPLIILGAVVVSKADSDARGYRLASVAAVIAFANLAFVILPGTKVEANPPLQFAQALNRVWPPDTQVYYDTLTTDDWTLQYFNPQTTWHPLKDLPLADGREVWIETTAYDRLKQTNPGWLAQRGGPQESLI